MSLKIVILCHVEPGTLIDGTIQYDFDREEGITRSLPAILEFADRHRVKMGFLLTAITHDLMAPDMDGHDVGIHVHPRDPALARRLKGRIRLDHDCLARYSASAQELLITTAQEAHAEALGREPRLFVSGRWSEDIWTLRILQRHGFTHDGSPLPGYHTSCADWSRLPRLAQPYAPDGQDYQRGGGGSLTYLPVYQGLWGHHLTPETIRVLGTSYFKAALHEAQVGGTDVVHVFFHSPLGLDPVAMDAFGEAIDYAQETLKARFVRPTSLTPSPRRRGRPFPPAYVARMDWTLMKSFAGRGELGRRIRGWSPPPPDPFH